MSGKCCVLITCAVYVVAPADRGRPEHTSSTQSSRHGPRTPSRWSLGWTATLCRRRPRSRSGAVAADRDSDTEVHRRPNSPWRRSGAAHRGPSPAGVPVTAVRCRTRCRPNVVPPCIWINVKRHELLTAHLLVYWLGIFTCKIFTYLLAYLFIYSLIHSFIYLFSYLVS